MQDTKRIWGCTAALSGFVSIAMGAVAAHALADAHAAALAEKAAWYQLVHSLLLLFLAQGVGKFIAVARWIISAGILFFCGGLYLYAVTGLEFAVHMAPIGGTSLMFGWILIALAFYKREFV